MLYIKQQAFIAPRGGAAAAAERRAGLGALRAQEALDATHDMDIVFAYII